MKLTSPRWTKRLVLPVMALVAMLFGAIAGLAAAPVTIKVMRPGYPKEARVFFTEVEQALVKEHPNIRLEIIDADWNTFHSRIPIWVSGRQEPDVYLCSPSDLAALVDIGAMMPLDSLVDTELKQDIPAGAWQDVKYKDKIYAIPAAVAPFVLWYNKDIFRQAGLDPAKPPTTWDELLSYSQQIKKNTGVAGLGIGLGRSLDFTQLVWGMLYYSATNANYVDGNGKSLITSADSIRAHQFLTDLVRKHQVSQPNPELYSKGDMRLLFRDGKVAMVVDGPWIMNTIKGTTDLSSAATSKYGIAPAPKSPIRGRKPMYAASIDSWVISANTRHPKEAQEVLKFLLRTENQYAHDKYIQQMPSRKSIYADVKKYPLADNWVYVGMMSMMDDTISFQPILPTATAVLDTMQDAVVKMVTGVAGVREALREAAAKINEMNNVK